MLSSELATGRSPSELADKGTVFDPPKHALCVGGTNGLIGPAAWLAAAAGPPKRGRIEEPAGAAAAVGSEYWFLLLRPTTIAPGFPPLAKRPIDIPPV